MQWFSRLVPPILVSLLVISVHAQHSGVLLGFETSVTPLEGDATQDFAAIHEPKYQTLWIAPNSAGELKVLVSIPELIAPRKDGFWHVGVKQVCEFTPATPDSGGNENLEQIVWAAPVTKAAIVHQTSPCTPHKPEDYAGPYMRSEADKNKISQCGFELVNVVYVSPEIISFSTYSSQSEECDPRGGRYTQEFKVRNFDSDQPVGFGQLLGSAAGTAYRAALPQQGKDDNEGECGESNQTDDTGWTVSHQHGIWRASVRQSLGYFGCEANATIRFPMPSSMTGDRSSVVDWKVLTSSIKGLKDAYVSPSSDMLIAATDSALEFYELSNRIPGKILLSLPAQTIVMAQWSTGSHVQDWTEQISRLAQQELAEPLIQVKTGPK